MSRDSDASPGTIMQLTCPECGGHCRIKDMKSSEDGSPVHVDITCPECGAVSVARDEVTGTWSVCGSDTPYNPWAKSNALTLLHRFDPSKFDSPEKALETEMSLYRTVFKEFMAVEFYAGARSIMPGMKAAWERAVAADVPGSRSDYAMFLMTEIPSAEGDELTSLLLRISQLVSESDVSSCCSIAKALGHMVERFPYMAKHRDQAVERIEQLLSEARESSPSEYVDAVNSVCDCYRSIGMTERISDVSRDLMSYLKGLPSDTEGLEDYMVSAYICALEDLSDEELRDAMEFLTAVADRNPEAYIFAVTRYVVTFWDQESEDALKARLDKAIDLSLDCGVMVHTRPHLYSLRYYLTGVSKDAVDAATSALALIESYPGMAKVVKSVLDDDSVPGRDRAAILREMRKKGVTEAMLDAESEE